MKIMKVEEKEGVGEVNKEIQQFFAYDKCRKYQANVINAMYNALLNKHHVILEAPAGWGKTSVALAASLPIQKEKNLKIIYACRTHQQIYTVLNELSKIKGKGININMLGLWGRKHLCANDLLNILPENVFRHTCLILRKSFRSPCPFFRPEEQWIVDNAKNIIYLSEAKKFFGSYQFCP